MKKPPCICIAILLSLAALLAAPVRMAAGDPEPGQAGEKVISDTSEDLTAYTVLAGTPKEGEGWGMYWGKCGYKNLDKEWVIQPQFDWAGRFHEGYALVVIGAKVHYEKYYTKWQKKIIDKTRSLFELLSFDAGRIAIIDKTGRVVLELPQIDGKLAIRLTMATADIENGKKVLHEMIPKILKSKNDAWTEIYSLDDFQFIDGLAWIPVPGGCNYIRKTGDSFGFVFPQPLAACHPSSDRMALAQDRSMKWGYVGTEGKWAIPPLFSKAHEFSQGVAPVESEGHWGAINKTGAMVIPAKYNDFVFHDGQAQVIDDGVKKIIDRNGRTLIVLGKYDADYSFQKVSNGLARGEIYDSGGWWNTIFVNMAGNKVFKFPKVRCDDFSQNLARCWDSLDEDNWIRFDLTAKVFARHGDTFRLESYLAGDDDATLNLKEEVMAARLQAGNQAEVAELAQTILKNRPDSVLALTVMTWLKRMAAAQGDAQAAIAAWTYAQQGLKALPAWKKPDVMTEANFPRARDDAAATFYGATALHALIGNDFLGARDYYGKSLALQPFNLLDLYQLGIAELSMAPPDVKGFWHIGRAIQVAREQKQTAAEQAITNSGKTIYRNYHGSEEGWEALVAGAKGQAPPVDFTVRRAPSPSSKSAKAGPPNDKALSKPVLATIPGLGQNQAAGSEAEAKNQKEIDNLWDQLFKDKEFKEGADKLIASLNKKDDEDLAASERETVLQRRVDDLFNAVAAKDVEKIKALLAAGADVNAKDDAGMMPLHYAVTDNSIVVAKQLLAAGATVNSKSGTGMTPLHIAAMRNAKDAAELLLANGADVSAKSNIGGTPLHYAAMTDAKEVAELLLAKGADVSATVKNGRTPLHLAAYRNSRAVAELLLAKGANVNAKDNKGDTPLTLAEQGSYSAMVQLLRAHGAKE